MALIAGPVQKFTNINVATTATSVGFVKNCFGARLLLVRVFNAVQANLVTITAVNSFDGSTADQTPFVFNVLPTGGVAADLAGSQVTVGLNSTILLSTLPITSVQLLAAQATAGGLVTFWVWPLFDAYNPALPRGGNLPT